MKICFQCFTPYQLLITYILSKTTYANDEKVIITDDDSESMMRLIHNIKNMNLWEDVIVCNGYDVYDIKKQIHKVDVKSFDVIHFFDIVDTCYGRIILNEASPRTKCIYTDEGGGTYNLKERINERNFEKSEWEIKEIEELPKLFEKISEIYVLKKDLVKNDDGMKITEIKCSNLLNEFGIRKDTINDLNKLFGYVKENYSDIIFFDGYLSKVRFMSSEYEKFLVETFFDSCNKYSIKVKSHPSYGSKDKYDGVNINFIKNSDIPWEVIYLNYIFDQEGKKSEKIPIMVFIYASTALMNSILLGELFGIKQNIILLRKITDGLIKENCCNVANYFYNKVVSERIIYSKVFEPKCFTEVQRVIDEISNKNFWDEAKYYKEKYKENIKELTFFKEMYKNDWQIANNAKLDNSTVKVKNLQLYYELLDNWLNIHLNNYSLEEYFLKNKYRKVAIYGMGNVGKNLFKELLQTSIEIICFIDKSIDKSEFEVPIIKPEQLENFKNIDSIIITPIFYYSDIKKYLELTGVNAKIISLKEIINEILEEQKTIE